jgi:hypothetical protein
MTQRSSNSYYMTWMNPAETGDADTPNAIQQLASQTERRTPPAGCMNRSGVSGASIL